MPALQHTLFTKSVVLDISPREKGESIYSEKGDYCQILILDKAEYS
jgi:hypothetical protein